MSPRPRIPELDVLEAVVQLLARIRADRFETPAPVTVAVWPAPSMYEPGGPLCAWVPVTSPAGPARLLSDVC